MYSRHQQVYVKLMYLTELSVPFLRVYILYLGMMVQPIYQVICKTYSSSRARSKSRFFSGYRLSLRLMTQQIQWYSKLFLNLFIYLFLAVLGLHCCMQAFSSCGEQRLLFLQCMGFSLLWLLLLQSMRSGMHGFQKLWLLGLVVVVPGL